MLLRYLLLYLLPLLCYSESYIPYAEVQSDPSGIVAGCVNAITGSYSHSQVDFVIPGAQPLTFQRFYCSGDWSDGASMCTNWTYNHPKEAAIGVYDNKYRLVIPEPSGAMVSYVTSQPVLWWHDLRYKYAHYPQASCHGIHSASNLDFGLTNTGLDCRSGNLNLKNQTASFDLKENTIKAQLSNGGVRTFKRMRQFNATLLPIYFTSVEETLPNGNRFCYEHSHGNSRMGRIIAVNKGGDQTFGSLSFDYTQSIKGELRQVKLRSNDNREASYTFKMTPEQSYLTEARSPNGQTEKYTYRNIGCLHERLSRKEGSDERFVQIDYYSEGHHPVAGIQVPVNKGSLSFGRVKHLKSPVGHDASPIVTHSFLYSKGQTDVRDAYNRRKIIRYNEGFRLEAIEHYLGQADNQYQKYATEKLFWGDITSNQHCDLTCNALLDHSNQVRSCRCLTYDSRHNVTTELLLGNLSGTCDIAPQIDSNGLPLDNGCERYAIIRTFSQDELNLLLTETLPNGQSTTYRYKPGTNLIQAKLVSVHGVIVARQFMEYDDNATLLLSIIDDGSGSSKDDLSDVAVRKITRITPRTETPCLGLPECIEEFYYNPMSCSEVSLGSISNTYSPEGWITHQDHCDAFGQLRYSLAWSYDRLGNITREQNAIGDVIIRRFDESGNKIFEQGPSHEFYTEYQYDRMNRLVAEIMVQGEQCLNKSYKYDLCGNRIASTDVCGNITHFAYDDLNRMCSSTLPGGHIIKMSYDISDNIIEEIDALGNSTHKQYNIRRQPTVIQHPDGTAERNEYDLEGNLRCHTATNGSYTLSYYDGLNNLVRKEMYSPNGELLAVTSATYKGFLVTSETDANGNVTSYTYDGAGRIVQTTKSSGWTRFEYDSLGRKYKTIQWIGPEDDNVKITIHEFDLLNRVVEERVDSGPCVNFEYDARGNCIAMISYTQEGPSTTRTRYNAFDKPTSIIDAYGNETLFHYSYNSGIEVTVVDALGRQTITKHDALGNPANIIKKDPFGNSVASTDLDYNAKGSLDRRVDTVKSPNLPDRTIVTQWQYDSIGRVVVLHEAVGTPLLRQTYYGYNQYGQKDAEILPGGIVLNYSYDAFGRLVRHTSSDGSIDYEYHYDPNGNLVSVYDIIHSETTTRTYDQANRMVREILANGLALSYEYDGLNRITQMSLPDDTSIAYSLTATAMESVSKLDPSKNIQYSHKYLERDPGNRITKSQLVGNAGNVDYSWDNLGRLSHMSHQFFEEQIPKRGYDAVGNIISKSRRDPLDIASCSFQFDPLNQLTNEAGLASHNYSYDSLHNRLSKDSSECIVNNLNQLVQQGDTYYGYDLRGNRISSGDNRYHYDALGRLIEVQSANGENTQYHYDPFNRRISKTGIHTTHYLYLDQLEIGAAHADGSIFQLRVLGQGKGAEIGAAVAIEIEGTVYAPLHDHSGNVAVLLSADTGQVVEFYRHTAFGEEDSYHSTINPWRFASKRHDPETGWIQFGRRYYDPDTARWVTPDPIGFQDGPNLYAYVHNNPLAHIDPTGLRAETCPHCGRPLDSQGRCRDCNYTSPNHTSLRGRVCAAVATAIYHLCPLSVIQRGTTELCSKVAEASLLDGCYDSPHIHTVPGNGKVQTIIVQVNGLNVSTDEAVARAEKESAIHGGATVIAVVDPKAGFVRDVGKAKGMFLGFSNETVELAEMAIQMALKEADARNGGVILELHSRGGLVGNLALKAQDEKSMGIIWPITCGSAKIIGDRGFAGTSNLIHYLDLVTPIADTIGYVGAVLGISQANARWIGPKVGIPGSNHGYDSYQEAVFEEANRAMDHFKLKQRNR